MTDGAGLAARAVAISSRTDKPVLDIFSVERRRNEMKVTRFVLLFLANGKTAHRNLKTRKKHTKVLFSL